ERADVPLASSGRGPGEALPAIEAGAVLSRAGERASPAGLAVRDPDLGRCEAREHSEGRRERVPVAKPGRAPEESHGCPREEGVGDDEAAQLRRNAPAGVNELDPGEREEEPDGRPDAEAAWIALRDMRRSPERLGPAEDRGPRIHHRPEIPDERGE